MKVLQILGDPAGGIRKHVHEIISNSNINDVLSYYIHGASLDATGKFDALGFTQDGINRVQITIKKRPHFTDISNILFIFIFCKRHNINVIHGHGAKGGIYCRIVGLLAGLPSIYTPHGGSIHATFGMIEGFFYRAVERILKPFTRFYLFESNYTFQRFILAAGNLSHERYLINHNGIDITSFLPNKQWLDGESDIFHILVVGVLREIKGQAVAINALALLRERSERKFHLHFCGAGPDLDKLTTLVIELNLESCVTFHGEVDDINNWYDKSNIVVIPSLFESFGYVAIEAALMRRPVIASNCGGLSEIIVNEETGYLFPVGNAELLSDRIIRIFDDIEGVEKCVSAGEHRVKRLFNSKGMLNHIYKTYHTVIK